jgi:preprotein translocase subunit SecG
MESVILVIHLIVALAIVAVVLVQPAEAGGFMGNASSMSNIMMPRRKGDVLTRMTTILATIFFMTSLTLAVIAGHKAVEKKSILDVQTEAPAAETTAPAPDATTLKEAAPAPTEKKPSAPISK